MNLYVVADPDNEEPAWKVCRNLSHNPEQGVPVLLGKWLCDPEYVEQIETQTWLQKPARAEFYDKVFELLSRVRAEETIQIVLTEPWQREIFRGLISEGKFNGTPILEAYDAGKNCNRKLPSTR